MEVCSLSENQQQTELPWYRIRGLQLRVLKKLYFADGKITEGKSTKSISGQVQKAIMVAIDEHARADNWCIAAHYTIGRQANMKVGTRDKPHTAHVRRAIRLMENHGYLISPTAKKRGKVQLRPNWPALIEMADMTDDERWQILTAIECNGSQQEANNETLPPAAECNHDAATSESHAPRSELDAPSNGVDAPSEGVDAPMGATNRENRSRNEFKRSSYRSINEIFLGQEKMRTAERLLGDIVDVVRLADGRADPEQYRSDWEFCAKLAMLWAARDVTDAVMYPLLDWMRETGPATMKYLVGTLRDWYAEKGQNIGLVLKSVYLPESFKAQAPQP